MQKVAFSDIGPVAYADAWAEQQRLHDALVQRKLDYRRQGLGAVPQEAPLHHLIFCEHPHVYTLGKSGSMDNLLLSAPQLAEHSIEFFKINRGGDITYHGPGQIVGYPIFDLDYFFTDVHRYVRSIEESIICTLQDYGIEGLRMSGYTGVWLPSSGWLPTRKICAIGVHLSRWVTMHGFAFNVNTDLSLFRNIIPCGIAERDKDVTSLSKELGRIVDVEEVKSRLKGHFSQIFGFEFIQNEQK
jgi:lipoyl(octanoyl) transferase